MLAVAKNLYEYRDLMFTLAWKNVALRYKQTYLGITWTILKPLTLMICSAGSITVRATSGSRPSSSAVEPFKSANSTLMVLRSPSCPPRDSIASCCERMRAAKCEGV